ARNAVRERAGGLLGLVDLPLLLLGGTTTAALARRRLGHHGRHTVVLRLVLAASASSRRRRSRHDFVRSFLSGRVSCAASQYPRPTHFVSKRSANPRTP